MVAFTRLWGFDEPLLLASTLRMPTFLQHGTHGAAGVTRRYRGRRADHHQRTAVAHLLLVGIVPLSTGIFTRFFLASSALGDGRGHFAGLTQTVAYHTILVADDHDGREAERATALRYLGNTLNAYEPVFQFRSLVLTFFMLVFDISL